MLSNTSGLHVQFKFLLLWVEYVKEDIYIKRHKGLSAFWILSISDIYVHIYTKNVKRVLSAFWILSISDIL